MFLLISIEPLDGGGSVMTVNGFDFGNVFVDYNRMRLAGQPDHAHFSVGKFHAFCNNPGSRNAGDIVMANQDKLSQSLGLPPQSSVERQVNVARQDMPAALDEETIGGRLGPVQWDAGMVGRGAELLGVALGGRLERGFRGCLKIFFKPN
jgi:hypothetical protein